MRATEHREEREIPSGSKMTARQMAHDVGDNKKAFLGGFRLWEERTTPRHGGYEEKATDRKRVA